MNQSKKGFIYTTIGATLWGINGAFAEFLFLQKGVTSDWLTPYRLLLAGVFLLVYLYARDKNKIFDIFRNTKDLIRVFVFGVFGMLGTQYTYFTTIQHSNAGIATVLQYFGPTLILLYVCFKEKRKPKPYEVVVLFLSLLGVFILATHGDMSAVLGNALGDYFGHIYGAASRDFKEIWNGGGHRMGDVHRWNCPFYHSKTMGTAREGRYRSNRIFIADCPFGKYFCVSVLSVRRRNYRAYESKYDSLYRTCGSYDMFCSIFRKSFFLLGCDRVCFYLVHGVYCSIYFG